MTTARKHLEYLAAEREKQANKLEEDQIHVDVVSKICLMTDVDVEMKVEILLQSIKDVAVIFHILKQFNSDRELDDQMYLQMLEVMTSKFYERGGVVEFDPRRYSNFDYA